MLPEWLKGADCKSVSLPYAGSNPAQLIINDISYKEIYSTNSLLTKIKKYTIERNGNNKPTIGTSNEGKNELVIRKQLNINFYKAIIKNQP